MTQRHRKRWTHDQIGSSARVGGGVSTLTLLFLSLLFAFLKYPNKGNLLPSVSCPQDFPLGFVTVGSNMFYLNKITSAKESVSYCIILPRDQMSLTSLNGHIQKATSGMTFNGRLSGPVARTDLRSVLTLSPRLGLSPPNIP